MKRTRVLLAATVLLLFLGDLPMAKSEETALPPVTAPGDLTGAHDFDFLMGDWRVHHRVNKAGKGAPWIEFESDCSERPLMGGRANVEEHRFERPTRIDYGVAVRTYDPMTATWAIWWLDSRAPHGDVDPPMKGRFEKGVGTFYSDSTLDGKPIKVRFLWTSIDRQNARWEQSYSGDGGKTWEVNWIMDFRRV